MRRKYSTVQIRLYQVGTAILLAGLLCATWLYLVATDDLSENDIVSYQIVAGHNYALTTADSKRYQYDMEQIGGKFAIVTNEITLWLSSLCHGRRLAYTLATLSIVAALVCFLAAQHPDYKLSDNNNER